jgi:hypothetical protein
LFTISIFVHQSTLKNIMLKNTLLKMYIVINKIKNDNDKKIVKNIYFFKKTLFLLTKNYGRKIFKKRLYSLINNECF